jgi:hypothetical protein
MLGSNSPRCAALNGVTLWTMGAAARKMRRSSWAVHPAGLRLEPGGLQQLAHAGGDDAVKLAGVGGHFFRFFSLRIRRSRRATGSGMPRSPASPRTTVTRLDPQLLGKLFLK